MGGFRVAGDRTDVVTVHFARIKRGSDEMLGDVLIQTLDGKVYFSESGKAFELLEFEKPESAAALNEVLKKIKGQAIGVAAVVHGRFGNEHMLNGGSLWFLADLDKTITGEAGAAVSAEGNAPT